MSFARPVMNTCNSITWEQGNGEFEASRGTKTLSQNKRKTISLPPNNYYQFELYSYYFYLYVCEQRGWHPMLNAFLTLGNIPNEHDFKSC